MTTSQSEFAALLASSGLHVFPCKFNSKLPAIKDFPHKATTDAAQIKAWWDGKSSNIGISTSHYATDQALIVLDIDIKKGKRGDLSLMQLELEGFELPPTFTVLTPSGGTHLYYRTPKALRQGVDLLGSGIDVRSLGGYVIGPGSFLDDKEYVITNKTQIAPAPEWLIQRLGAARKRDTTTTKTLPGIKPDRAAQRAKEWLEKYAPIATEGEGGDSETFKVSAHLKDLGCSADQALELMAEWNERCSPPWSMDDLETKVRNAFKYGREPRGIAAPEAVFTAIEEPMPAPEAKGKTPDTAIGLKLKRGTEIVDREQRWLVPDFLPDESLIILAGQIGLGKTTACMDLAASITNGRVPIIGGKREARNVLMLSNEDSEAQLRRIFTRLGGNLSLLYVEDEDSDLPWGLGDLPALEARIVELRPALVIIDSLTTHKPSKVDMNSHGDVAPMLVGLRKLTSQYGCAIVVIHHTNKSLTSDPLAKISGSIGISAIARHVILVARHPEDENLRVAAIAKTNLCKPGAQSYQFRLDPFGWHGGTELRAADLLQGSTGESEPDAEDFLRDALADGKVDSAGLFRQGEGGYGLNRRSIQRAADRLNVERTFAGFGAGRKVYWSLPFTIDDAIDDKTEESVIDGRQSMKSALFDAGSTIDDKKQESVIDVSSMDGPAKPIASIRG